MQVDLLIDWRTAETWPPPTKIIGLMMAQAGLPYCTGNAKNENLQKKLLNFLSRKVGYTWKTYVPEDLLLRQTKGRPQHVATSSLVAERALMQLTRPLVLATPHASNQFFCRCVVGARPDLTRTQSLEKRNDLTSCRQLYITADTRNTADKNVSLVFCVTNLDLVPTARSLPLVGLRFPVRTRLVPAGFG